MILITGATGRIGRHLVRQLSQAGVRVRAFTRDLEKAAWIRQLGVEVVQGDMSQPETLDVALQGVRKAFLLSKEHPQQVALQASFIAAAQRAKLEQVVKLSGIGAELDSPVVVRRWHAETERQLRCSGLAFTFIRPNFLMQNTSLHRRSLLQEGRIYAPMGKGRVAQVHALDIAAVAAATLTQSGHEGATYDVSGPRAMDFDDVAHELSLALGKPVRYVDLEPDQAHEHLLSVGLPRWHADSIITDFRLFREGDGDRVTDVVQRLCGRQPTGFAQFARDYVAELAQR